MWVEFTKTDLAAVTKFQEAQKIISSYSDFDYSVLADKRTKLNWRSFIYENGKTKLNLATCVNNDSLSVQVMAFSSYDDLDVAIDIMMTKIVQTMKECGVTKAYAQWFNSNKEFNLASEQGEKYFDKVDFKITGETTVMTAEVK